MTFSPRDFAEDTDFERFALGLLGTHRVDIPKAAMTYDARGERPHQAIEIGSVVSGARSREELAESLRPLGFAAAYKVLDLLIEHTLRANRSTSVRRFDQKVRGIVPRPALLPTPLDTRPDMWDRLAKLYEDLQEGRHAVTHRRAQATPAGDLEIYNEVRQLIDTLSSDELGSFAAAVHAAAELVIESDTDERRTNIVAWHLNALAARHGLPMLPATDPTVGRRLLRMDLVDLDDGALRFNAPAAKEIIAFQTPSFWDLELYSGDRVFVGRWEDVTDPTAPVDFHSGVPPAWLSEQIRT